MLQCDEVRCSICSVLQCLWGGSLHIRPFAVLLMYVTVCAAMCCSVLQCVAVSVREISPNYRPFAVLLRYVVVDCKFSLHSSLCVPRLKEDL